MMRWMDDRDARLSGSFVIRKRASGEHDCKIPTQDSKTDTWRGVIKRC